MLLFSTKSNRTLLSMQQVTVCFHAPVTIRSDKSGASPKPRSASRGREETRHDNSAGGLRLEPSSNSRRSRWLIAFPTDDSISGKISSSYIMLPDCQDECGLSPRLGEIRTLQRRRRLHDGLACLPPIDRCVSHGDSGSHSSSHSGGAGGAHLP
jgi:hypothetical protein